MPDEVTKQDAADGGEVTLDQLKEQLAVERKGREDEAAKRAAAEKNYQAQSAVLAAAKREADEAKRRASARRQPPPDDDEYDDEPEQRTNGRAPRVSDAEARLAEQSQLLGMLNYKIDHPEALPQWEEIMSIITDPMKVEDVVHRNADGSVNAYKTFAKAHEKVEIAKLRAASADARSQEAKKKADELKAQATISGGGAFDRGDMPDLAGKSAEEQRKILVARGALRYDPDDPPSWAKGR